MHADFELLRPKLTRYCERAGAGADAEDAVQQVFIALLQLNCQLGVLTLEPWCFRKCRDICRNLRRRRKFVSLETNDSDSDTRRAPASWEAVVEDKESDDTPVMEILETLLGELPTSHEVLMRLSLLGLNDSQVAQVMLKTFEATTKLLNRTRRLLGLPRIAVHNEISDRLTELLTDGQRDEVLCILDPPAEARVA